VKKEEALQSTNTGQVVTSLGGSRIQDFNRAKARRLSAKIARRRISPPQRQGLVPRIRQRLALPGTAAPQHAKGFGEVTVGGSTVEKPPLETEPETVVPMHVVLSKSALGRRRRLFIFVIVMRPGMAPRFLRTLPRPAGSRWWPTFAGSV
jgi:hypothetical protein